MKWVDIQQNEDDWFQIRAGRVGGSSIKHVMANYGQDFGEPAKRLALKIAIEQETGNYISDNYFNDNMARGHEEEPIARKLYEDEKFCSVTNGGYFILDDYMGCSPDGMVRVQNYGLIEIKSRMYHIHEANWNRGKFDPADKWQLIHNLFCSDAEWIDYISFCSPYFKNKRIFIDRLYRKDCSEEFDMIYKRMNEFKRLVDSKK